MHNANMQLEEVADFPGEAFFAFADKHGVDSKLFCVFAGYEGIHDPQEALEAFIACNAGTAKNLACWARDFVEKTGMIDDLSERLRPYFNYAAWAQDAEERGDIWIIELYDDEITVFWSRPN